MKLRCFVVMDLPSRRWYFGSFVCSAVRSCAKIASASLRKGFSSLACSVTPLFAPKPSRRCPAILMHQLTKLCSLRLPSLSRFKIFQSLVVSIVPRASIVPRHRRTFSRCTTWQCCQRGSFRIRLRYLVNNIQACTQAV